jgi:hypothetical protein
MRAFETFDLWLEEWDGGGGGPINVEVYRNKRGAFVGARHRGRRCGIVRGIAKLEISPIKNKSTHSTCSIGKSAIDGKWYGWSHRAMVGFGLGDRIFEERYGNDQTLFAKHGRKKVRTDRDARMAASRFARSVS